MADIEFIDFVPMAESVTFDDGEGGTSLDEWQMVMNLGDAKIPLSVDPLFGEFHGQAAIRAWLTDIMARAGALAFEPLGKPLFDGTTSVLEWKQMAVAPDGTRTMMLRGTSVRRYADGWVVYAADYFDTAPLADPDIAAAAIAAGSTVSAADVLRYRRA